MPPQVDAADQQEWRTTAAFWPLDEAWRTRPATGAAIRPSFGADRSGGDGRWGGPSRLDRRLGGGLWVPLLDATGARQGDEAAVDRGATWAGLMATAAGHLARGVIDVAGRAYGLKVAVVVGRGNNGGDGWAAASRLVDMGAAVRVVAVDGIDATTTEEAAACRAQWLAAGGRASGGLDGLSATLRWAEVAIDALLGTGAKGAPRNATAVAVEEIVTAHADGTLVVACDLPSGVDADDGAVAGLAVVADATVTFGAPKRGLMLDPGRRHAGQVLVGGLGTHWVTGDTSWRALTAEGARLEPLDDWADKWTRGRVLVVAGAPGTAGAAVLAGGAALRSGAGLVTLAVPAAIEATVASRSDPGVMVRGFDPTTPARQLVDELQLDDIEVVVAGPGLGRDAGVAELVAELLLRPPATVLDADALNVFKDDPSKLADHDGPLVLTPHRRELARIGGGSDGADAWRHRAKRVPSLAADLDAIVVAKGPATMVAAPDGRVWICPWATAALGSGGTGDVLAGVIGASLACRGEPGLAAARAVWWHAAAGMIAGRLDRRATATDVLAALPTAIADPGQAWHEQHDQGIRGGQVG
ncbi:MAG: NAD(P)H-hydrate dehydratase, partial [Nitriliruptoraceae bacterium]